MAKLSRVAGSTSHVLTVFVQDSTSTAGAGLAGLLFNTSGLTCYYKRNSGTASVAVTLATITTLGTFTSGGFKEIDSVNMPGTYEFHPPNAAYASGAKSVTFYFQGAANMAPLVLEVELTAVDNQSATAFVTGINSLAPPINWNTLTIDAATGGVTVKGSRIEKNTALNNFMFPMVLSSDHVTVAPGLTVTAQRSIDGAAFGSCTNAVAEVSNGIYKINLSAADLNGDSVVLRFSAATADTRLIPIITQTP